MINKFTFVAIIFFGFIYNLNFVLGETVGDDISKLFSVPFSSNIEVTSQIIETNLEIQLVSRTSINEFYSTSLSAAKIYINRIDNYGLGEYAGRIFMHYEETIELTRNTPTRAHCEISNQYTVNKHVYGYDPNIGYYNSCEHGLPKYVIGPSDLLGLIDCHREKFKLVQGSRNIVKIRNLPVFVYEAKLEPTFNAAAFNIPLIIRVYIDSTSLQKSTTNKNFPDGLPVTELPISIELVSPLTWSNDKQISSEFAYDECHSQLFKMACRKVQVDFYRIEKIAEFDLMDSESKSIFSMPLGSGCSDTLQSKNLGRKWKIKSMSEFSFEAVFMTGANTQNQTPIRYKVAYDGVSKIMRRDVTDLRRGKDLISSTIYDGRGWLKYHQYRSSLSDTISNINGDNKQGMKMQPVYFQKCVTSSMSYDEFKLLENIGSMLNIDDAVFMGVATVRGVICNVYEKKLDHYPTWIVSKVDQESEKYVENDARIYAVYYEANLDGMAGKLMRISIMSTLYDKPYNREAEIYSFSWSLHSFDGQASINNLFDISHCLEKGRHVKIAMSFHPNPSLNLQDYDTMVRGQLKNELTRDNALLKTICNTLNVPKPQIIDASSKLTHGSMVLMMTLIDLPGEEMSTIEEGRAFDMTIKSYGKFEQGHHAYTQEECKWWAMHDTNAKSFMYCPLTAHCLIESQGEPWPRETAKTKGSLVRFNSVGMCTVFTVTRATRKSRFIYNGAHYDPDMFSTMDMEMKLYKQKYELKFHVEEPVKNEKDETTANTKEVILAFKLENFKMTKVSSKSGDDETGESRASLQGLGHILSDELGNKRAETVGRSGVSHDLISCHQACTVDDECRSFSMCRQRGKFDCILSGQNFTNSLVLSSLFYKKTVVFNGDIIEIDTGNTSEQTGDSSEDVNASSKFKVRVDKYCNIYNRRHLESFQWVENKKTTMPVNEARLKVESAEDCARMCLDVARNFKLNGGDVRESLTMDSRKPYERDRGNTETDKPSYWMATCFAFEFSEEYKICITYPMKTHTAYDEWQSKNKENANERKSLGPMKDVQSDYYTLKMINLYHGTFGYRLENSEDRYVIYMSISAEECARRCFMSTSIKTCKSFDMIVMKEEAYGQRMYKCQLNKVSLNDYDADYEKNTLVTNDDRQHSWHYEPNWMASLYMNVDHDNKQQMDGSDSSELDDTNDNEDTTSNSHTHIYLSVIILFIIAVGGLCIGFTVTRFYFEFTQDDSLQMSNRPHERLKG